MELYPEAKVSIENAMRHIWADDKGLIFFINLYIIIRSKHNRAIIGDITESSLTKQLRELEADGFITRYDYKEVPPRVEYNLTDLGKSFIPVFEHMKQWGDENLSE